MSEPPLSVEQLRAAVEQLRVVNARLRDVVAAKDELIAEMEARHRAEIVVQREALRRLELRIAELERQRDQDSSNSGTPSSKDSIAAKERRKAGRGDRDVSSRERSADRKRGGQPGRKGTGLQRDPRPDDTETVEPPAGCRSCGEDLSGAAGRGFGWSQTFDVRIERYRIEYRLPRRECGCCGTVTMAVPPWGRAGTVSYGPVLNTAAVVLSSYGNVPAHRSAAVIGLLLGEAVSAGFVDRANARLGEALQAAGFDERMLAALLSEPVLAADESPVNLLRPDVHPGDVQQAAGEQTASGSPHVLVIRTPAERLSWLTWLGSRRHDEVIDPLKPFTGFLIVDGYGAYPKLEHLAGIQQCVQHVFRRCKQVQKLGPGGLQSWAADVRAVLAEANTAVQEAKDCGRQALDPKLLAGLRTRYDTAVSFGLAHNRYRDWDDGNHPGHTLATWLHTHADQVWLFTRHFCVEWTNNSSERTIKDPKRHQAVSGYWHTPVTLARWCRIRSYLTSTRNHGVGVLDAITHALTGHPLAPRHRVINTGSPPVNGHGRRSPAACARSPAPSGSAPSAPTWPPPPNTALACCTPSPSSPTGIPGCPPQPEIQLT